MADPAIEQIVITDSVSRSQLAAGPVRDKLVCLECSGLFAEAIRRIHEGGSLTELLAIP